MLEDIKKPAEDFVKEAGDYVDMRISDGKLKITEGLSVGLGRLCALAVILMVLSITLITLRLHVSYWWANCWVTMRQARLS